MTGVNETEKNEEALT